LLRKNCTGFPHFSCSSQRFAVCLVKAMCKTLAIENTVHPAVEGLMNLRLKVAFTFSRRHVQFPTPPQASHQQPVSPGS
jgi:hypothetical protein